LVIVATHDQRLIPLADRVVELTPATADAQPPSRVVLEPGEVLFERGTTSDSVYVVEEGQIALVRERPGRSAETLRLAGPGEYFGELGPLLRRPRSATARALTDTVVTGYSPQDFKQAATQN
jgi:putative ABC transport system ATP-binding protein